VENGSGRPTLLLTLRALRVAARLEQFDDGGLAGPQHQRVQRRGSHAVHPRVGHEDSRRGQAGGPGGIQAPGLGPDVEQDEEVDTTPGAQEGQDGWRGKGGVRGGGVGGGGRIKGEESKTAKQKSFFSGSGVSEGGEERCNRALLVLREGERSDSHNQG